MDAPFLLWSMTWKEGKELQATEEAKTKLLETIKTKGYVSIAVDAAVQEYLREAALYVDITDAPWDIMPGKTCQQETCTGRLADILLARVAPGFRCQPLLLGAALLHRLSRSVLHALLSAPSSIGNVDAFDALLNEHEQDETGVIINSHYTTNTASAGAAQCKCHDWQVERGLMTVMWSDSPGLEVKVNGETKAVPHGNGSYVTCFPGLTLQTALLGTVRATEYREDYTGTTRISALFRLSCPSRVALDSSLLRIQPVTVANLQSTINELANSDGYWEYATLGVRAARDQLDNLRDECVRKRPRVEPPPQPMRGLNLPRGDRIIYGHVVGPVQGARGADGERVGQNAGPGVAAAAAAGPAAAPAARLGPHDAGSQVQRPADGPAQPPSPETANRAPAAARRGAAATAAAAGAPETLTFTIRDPTAQYQDAQFKVKPSTKFSDVLYAYSTKRLTSPDRVQLLFRGQRVLGHQAVATVGVKDGDRLDALLKPF